MPITTKTGWVAFLITITSLNISVAKADTPKNTVQDLSLESRLSRIATTIKEREHQLSESSTTQPDGEIALGWVNGRGNRGFVNTRRGGWGDGHRGGFANINPWRNGWVDRGGFFNHRGW